MNLLDAALEASVVGGFSRIGYEVRSRLNHWDRDYDLAGKRILITGGTSGIGYAAARAAVAGGASVVITGRSAERTQEVAASIGALALAADAGDLAGLPAAFDAAVDLLGGLDVLVNNAGALDDTYSRTAQGFEVTYAVHVLAPFLLTARALDVAQTVITVSSGGMYSQTLDPASTQMTAQDYNGTMAYSRAKRAQVALNQEWARRFPAGPTFAAMHPGWADTAGVQRSLPRFRTLTRPILRSPEQGADTILWLAGHRVPSGLFWSDRTPRSTMRVPWLRYGQGEVEALWTMVAEQAGVAELVG